jgi:hypothetical protein
MSTDAYQAFSGQVEQQNGGPFSSASVSGVYTYLIPGGTGEFSADGSGSIVGGGSYSVSPSGRGTGLLGEAFYLISPSRIFLLGGDADAQVGAPFSLPSVRGNYGFYVSGPGIVLLGRLTADGAGTISSETEDIFSLANGYSGALTGSGTYSVLNPRGQGIASLITSAGTSQFTFYMSSSSDAVLAGNNTLGTVSKQF